MTKNTSQKGVIISVPIFDFNDQDEILLLGTWCETYSERSSLKNVRYQLHEYHWENHRKLSLDNQYLSSLYENKLLELSLMLNSYHKVNFSIRFWRILIGPWLLTIISTLWDRWEIVRTALESVNKDSYVFKKLSNNKQPPPLDYNQSIKQIGSDYWNEAIFSKIMDIFEIPSIEIDSKEFKNPNNTSSNLSSRPWFYKIIDFFISSNKDRKITIYHAYFPKIFSLFLNLRLFHKTRLDKFFHKQISFKFSNRSDIDFDVLDFKFDSKFELFFNNNVLEHIPISYLEGFKELIDEAAKIPSSEVILTANAHFGNELFKVWSGLNCERGSKLIISSHGGAFYPKFSVFDHQEHISNIRVIWGQSWYKNQVTLPPNKLSYKIKKYNKRGSVSIIDNDSLKYSYRCMSASQGPLVLKSYKKTESLIHLMKKESMNIKIKPKYSGDNETALRYEDKFGKDMLFSSNSSIKKIIQQSKIVVCTYPQTAYAESMFSGIPTLLFYDSEIWQTQEIYSELLDLMLDNNMIFECDKKAVTHIKSISEDPLKWWNSKEISDVRKIFNHMCITKEDSKMREWTTFLKSAIND